MLEKPFPLNPYDIERADEKAGRDPCLWSRQAIVYMVNLALIDNKSSDRVKWGQFELLDDETDTTVLVTRRFMWPRAIAN